MACPPIDWRGTLNEVHVRIQQRAGLRARWVELRAVGTSVTLEAAQFTDASRSPTPTWRTRTLRLDGLTASWERHGLETYQQDGVPVPQRVVLTLRRPGRPDVYIPELDAEDDDMDRLCAALAEAAAAAARVIGHGRAEVPQALRSLIRDHKE
jgi:hypothetical protein